MVKIKNKTALNTGTGESKATPYRKTSNGRVRKLRINLNKSSAKLKQSNNSDKKNCQLAISDSNSCFADLHTHPANSIFSNGNNCNALQEQCKEINEPEVISGSSTNLQKTSKYGRRLQANKILEMFPYEKNNNSKRDVDKTSGRQQHKPKLLSPVTTGGSVSNLRKGPVNEKERKSILKSTRKVNVRLKRIDKCEINAGLRCKYKEKTRIESYKGNISNKIDKSYDSNINDFNTKSCNEPNSTRVNQGQQRNQANISIPGATKRFVVKLRNTPVLKKTERNLLGPLIPKEARNFVVRIKKIENSRSKSKSIATDNELKLHSTKNSINENELNGIKQIAELSLRRSGIGRNKNKTISDDTMCFDPVRNSTLLAFGKNTHRHTQNDRTEIKTPAKNRSPFRNLTNKSEKIETVLLSLDDEDEICLNSPQSKHENCCNENVKTQKNNSNTHDKPKKFFHRENVIEKTILKEDPKQKTTSTHTEKLAKKRRFYTKRSTFVNKDQIYEFASQSQTSDSDIAKHGDPTADIVKKLIDQGKVRVATNSKGTGKPRMKRINCQRKQINGNKARKKIKGLKKYTRKVQFTDENKNDIVEEDHNFDDHFEDHFADAAEQFTRHEYHAEMERRDIVSNISNIHTTEQEGTFSRLARSVIINQAGRSDWQQKHPSVLSRKELNLVSTPKVNRMLSPQTVLEMDLSPIVMARPKPLGMTSPWRVNEDTHLPATFNFCRSSGNLPSFSSDFIPSTPRKEKAKIYLNRPDPTDITKEISPTKCKDNDDVENIQRQASKLNESSVLSSFSSNDSNAENMPPSKRTSESLNENESLFNLEQPPNHHRPNHRSPLKALNIIEVLHLPPLQYMKKTITEREQRAVISGFDDNLKDSYDREQSITTITAEQRNYSHKKTETHSKEDLFGFEDYLSQTQFSSQENSETNNNIETNVKNQTIHDKLQDLRKFKPDGIEFQKPTKPIKAMALFADDDDTKINGMRQRGIKEMLCSTMLHPQPSTSKEALRQLKKANLVPRLENKLDHTDLFNDPDPETTFSEKEARRTYIRPHRRKPKLRENNYIVYLDSDASEAEDDSYENQKQQHSRESNSSTEHAPKMKRNRKKPKENPELEEFVKEFNEMCKDVDSYNIVVEKSK